MASAQFLLPMNQLCRHPTTSFRHKPSHIPSLSFRRKLNRTLSLSLSLSHSYNAARYESDEEEEEEEERVIGDCLVFEEGVFEDPYLSDEFDEPVRKELKETRSVDNLVPEKWKEVQDAINITKKERRFIAQQAEFGVKLDRKRKGLVPLRNEVLEEEYIAFRKEKLAQLNPLVLDNPSFVENEAREGKVVEEEVDDGFSGRVKPKNPKWAVYGRSMNDITEFFNSGDYVPGDAAANQGKSSS